MASDLGTSFTSQQHPCSSAEGTIPPLQQHETSSSTHTIIEKPSCAKLNVIKKMIVAIFRNFTAEFNLDRFTLLFFLFNTKIAIIISLDKIFFNPVPKLSLTRDLKKHYTASILHKHKDLI